MVNDLEKRLFDFTVSVLKMLRKIKACKETDVIRYQLSKSATSTGANYREAQAGSSKADFINKVGIAHKEIRETTYWLELLAELPPETPDIQQLLSESIELSKIMAAILVKSKNLKNT